MEIRKPFLGADYYPEDWPEEQISEDIRKMKDIGITVVRIAEFAWHRMEPHEGEFDFSFFHRVVDRMRENGIGVILGTPTATPPAWLVRKYPDMLLEDESGRRSRHGGRRHCCSNNAHYIEYSMRIVEKMAQSFERDPGVIGWQIDNEIYLHGNGCFCPDCMRLFREELKKKYGTIDAVNEAWNTNLFSQWYDDFEDIPEPRDAWHNPHLKLEWRLFQARSHIRFVHLQADILHRYFDVPIGTDTMPFYAMDYREMTEKLDIVEFNHYNTPENLYMCAFWFDYLRTLKDRPFWNTETATCWNGSTAITQSIKPDGYCVANSWLPIALGGEANMYWLWRTHWAGHELMHGAVLDASGREMLSTSEVRQTARGFEKASGFIADTRVRADAAIHFSSLNCNMHDATQMVVNGWIYDATIQKNFYLPMIRRGLRPDVIDATVDPSRYRLIFSPMMMTLDESHLAERMEKWVRGGGNWVVGPLTDVRTGIGSRYTDRFYGSLEKLTGVKGLYGIPDTEGRVQARWSETYGGESFRGNTWFEAAEDAGQEILVKITGGHKAIEGCALVYRVQVGLGQVIVLGSVPSEEDMNRLLETVCPSAGVAIPESSEELIVSPRKGAGREGWILVNIGEKAGRFTPGAACVDLLSGEKTDGSVSVEPYGVRVLEKL